MSLIGLSSTERKAVIQGVPTCREPIHEMRQFQRMGERGEKGRKESIRTFGLGNTMLCDLSVFPLHQNSTISQYIYGGGQVSIDSKA